jgi:hypothetical protein
LDDLSEVEFYAIAKEIASENKKMYWIFHVWFWIEIIEIYEKRPFC